MASDGVVPAAIPTVVLAASANEPKGFAESLKPPITTTETTIDDIT